MKKPIPPIFIIDGEDVSIYKSVQDAAFHLEPIDVRNGEYVAYDSKGNLLRLETTQDDNSPIVISFAEEGLAHVKALEVTLRGYLKAMGEQVNIDPPYDLSCLVELSQKYIYVPKSLKELIVLPLPILIISKSFGNSIAETIQSIQSLI